MSYRAAICDDSTTDAEFVGSILHQWAAERGIEVESERFLALMFCTKKSEKTGIPDEIGCESTALWAKNLTHIGRTCKINQ